MNFVHSSKLIKFVHIDLELDDEFILAINKLCLHIVIMIPIAINHSPKEFKKYIDERFQIIYKIKTKPKINPFLIRKILKKYSPGLNKYSKVNIYLSYIIEHLLFEIFLKTGNMAKAENKKIIDKQILVKYLSENPKYQDLVKIIN